MFHSEAAGISVLLSLLCNQNSVNKMLFVWSFCKLALVVVTFNIGCNRGFLKASGMKDNFLGLSWSQDGGNFVVK